MPAQQITTRLEVSKTEGSTSPSWANITHVQVTKQTNQVRKRPTAVILEIKHPRTTRPSLTRAKQQGKSECRR